MTLLAPQDTLRHHEPADAPSAPARFLGPIATSRQIRKAIAANHSAWFAANAWAAGGETALVGGFRLTDTPGSNGEVILAFPPASLSRSGELADQVMAAIRSRTQNRAAVWTLGERGARALGARLCARGFEWGWQPHWMARDLNSPPPRLKPLDSLEIALDDAGEWEVKDLPYHDREGVLRLQLLAAEAPRQVWRLAARLAGTVVGQTVLWLPSQQNTVAGIYNVGVVPAARHAGIGGALTWAACAFARQQGCQWATLNSAADDLYEKLGFVSLGRGQTWWMHSHQFATPPTPAQVAFAEAVGLGDVPALDALPRTDLPRDLDAPLPCGLTPLQLAVKTRKPAAIRWLTTRGATLGVLDAWDMGWKARVPRLLKAAPALASVRSGSWQTTPLHEAVTRKDLELARVLLAAGADREAQDAEFHSTPLGWARHFGHAELVMLLEAPGAE